MANSCALCKKDKPLQISHIVPSFAGKWLKESSATGFMRELRAPNERIQDVWKTQLLCRDCEQLLSGFETYFAKEIFYPYLEGKNKPLTYDDRFLKFAVSLSWRLLVLNDENFKKNYPQLLQYSTQAEESWRNYLLGCSINPGPFEHHVFFFDQIAEGQNIPTDFQWYTLRAVDSTVVGNNEKALVYSKLPSIMFVSAICPANLEGWSNTRILEKGQIKQPGVINDAVFYKFLIDRYNWIRDQKPILTEPEPRMLRAMLRDPDKALESKSFEVMLIETKRERDKRKAELHPTVQSLIKIVESMHNDQSLPKKLRMYLRYDGHLLADTLVAIEKADELKIASLMEATIRKSKINGEDSKFVFTGKDLTIIFMVNLFLEQKSRGDLVCTELSEGMKKRKTGERRHFLVISWNPFEASFQYICKCYVDYELFQKE
jgi:hypothetical protein